MDHDDLWTRATGTLQAAPARERTDLLAEPVTKAIEAYDLADARVAPIDPDLADTEAFCAAYDIPLDISANCVVVAGRRGAETRYAACLVLATMRADVNGVIRRRLEARKASFAPMDDAIRLTGMEYGGITPIGVPEGWPILIDEQVAAAGPVVVGSGLRRSKIVVPARSLLRLPGAETIALAQPPRV